MISQFIFRLELQIQFSSSLNSQLLKIDFDMTYFGMKLTRKYIHDVTSLKKEYQNSIQSFVMVFEFEFVRVSNFNQST